ncbi:MAG: thioredoxin family protein [Thermodesulfobacteriota bacterium]
MKTSHWLVCLAALALGVFFLTSSVALGATVDPDKPVIYEFARRLCPVCLKNSLVLKDVQAKSSDRIDLRFIYIDTEEHLFRRYDVTFVPTQVFLDASGMEVDRHEGPLTEAELIAILKRLNFIRD